MMASARLPIREKDKHTRDDELKQSNQLTLSDGSCETESTGNEDDDISSSNGSDGYGVINQSFPFRNSDQFRTFCALKQTSDETWQHRRR